METVPKFQYPCYVDVCTFPDQYCNSDRNELRCSSCSRFICDQSRVPQACNYYCLRLDAADTTTVRTTTAAASSATDPLKGVNQLMLYSVVVTSIIFMTVFAFVAWYCLRKNAKDKKSRKGRVAQESDPELSGAGLEQERMALIRDAAANMASGCPHCGRRTQTTMIATPPPSYETNDFSSNIAVNHTPARVAQGCQETINESALGESGRSSNVLFSVGATNTTPDDSDANVSPSASANQITSNFHTNATNEDGGHEKDFNPHVQRMCETPLPVPVRDDSDDDQETSVKQSNR